MENVVLVIHLILALCLIGVVLLQRSEGGGLGIGGGGGGGVMSGRGAASALSKLTWGFAIAFIITSLVLTVFAASGVGGGSVLDRIGGDPVAIVDQDDDAVFDGSELLPPALDDAPLTPPRAD